MTPNFAGLRAGMTTNQAGTAESTCCILPEIKSFLLLSDVTNVTYTNIDMYVRMYVCIYVCMYICTYVRMYVCTYARMHVCTYARMHVCTYARMHVCTYARMHVCTYVSYIMFFLLFTHVIHNARLQEIVIALTDTGMNKVSLYGIVNGARLAELQDQ